MKVITICGLAGSGKGTIAKTFARKYGYEYADIGLIFRAIAHTSDTYRPFSYYWDGEKANIVYHGFTRDRDITKELLTEEVAKRTAKMASYGKNLDSMTKTAESILAGKRNLICDGRNAGTTIFPNARFKFYAFASIEVRAKRRWQDLISLGYEVEYQDVLRDMKNRDRIDSERVKGKAERPRGAIDLNTEELSVEQSVEVIFKAVNGERD